MASRWARPRRFAWWLSWARPGAVLLLGPIWWSANKLTWDCTVIDDHDASGAGLVDQLKRRRIPPSQGVVRRRSASAGARTERRMLRSRWLIYVSGCGPDLWMRPVMALISASDADSEIARLRIWPRCLSPPRWGCCCWQSFAGLRRYLRQRQIPMPSTMARAWWRRERWSSALYFERCCCRVQQDSTPGQTWASNPKPGNRGFPRLCHVPRRCGAGRGAACGASGAIRGHHRDPGEENVSREIRSPETSTRSSGPGQSADTARAGASGGSGISTSVARRVVRRNRGLMGCLLLKGLTPWQFWRWPGSFGALVARGGTRGWNGGEVGKAETPRSASNEPRRRRFADFRIPFARWIRTNDLDELAVCHI